VVSSQPPEVQEVFGKFAATVSVYSNPPWPGATDPQPFIRTNRSALADLSRPSMAWLRVRAIFGVGARAEIVRVFLSGDGSDMNLADLAEATSYTKRNIADECSSLAEGGLLIARRSSNRFTYSLTNQSGLKAFVGRIAPVRPNWTAVLNVTREMIALEALATGVSPLTLPVHAKKTADRIASDLADLGFGEPFRGALGSELWPLMQSWAYATLSHWAAGSWS
jgi:DNA-binding transcriptional ArsR family regulator